MHTHIYTRTHPSTHVHTHAHTANNGKEVCGKHRCPIGLHVHALNYFGFSSSWALFAWRVQLELAGEGSCARMRSPGQDQGGAGSTQWRERARCQGLSPPGLSEVGEALWVCPSQKESAQVRSSEGATALGPGGAVSLLSRREGSQSSEPLLCTPFPSSQQCTPPCRLPQAARMRLQFR